ncbi:MAG: YggS family pyridoxal phosphate-dependent enzyme [Dehalococcoidia bacterium]|nr:YggS family pyridoxal phosphate-dependent enzyme [Dehalococcoidia bacterium]
MTLADDVAFLDLKQRIAGNLRRLRERIAAACERSGRSPDEVTVVGVTKGFPVSAVVAAYEAGLRDLGENRVQEAATKFEAAAALGARAGLEQSLVERPRWHMVGHLQSNKVKTALRVFDIIHSVDSLRLAELVSREARAPVPVLFEVNVAGEESKFGLAPDDAPGVLARARALPNIDVLGLMTVAPITDDPERVRPVFRRLRELARSLGLLHLSMGMTDDFEVAIEEGATMVRIGRAIFGERPNAFEMPRPSEG